MSVMIDTPDGIAFAKAAARKGALSLEIKGMHRSGGQQTTYSIVKEVYGFRGTRESVLEDLTEYIEAELRLRNMRDEDYAEAARLTQELIDRLAGDEQLDQPHFEQFIFEAEGRGAINHNMRQAMSDLFYVIIVRQNAQGR
jgi:hypothetical protein